MYVTSVLYVPPNTTFCIFPPPSPGRVDWRRSDRGTDDSACVVWETRLGRLTDTSLTPSDLLTTRVRLVRVHRVSAACRRRAQTVTVDNGIFVDSSSSGTVGDNFNVQTTHPITVDSSSQYIRPPTLFSLSLWFYVLLLSFRKKIKLKLSIYYYYLNDLTF